MTIPLHQKAIGIEKTVLLAKQALLKRLQARGWTVREGIPRPRALPNDGAQAISVWLFPTRTRSDDEGQATNWHSEVFATNWLITIVTSDTSPDRHETSMDPIVQAAGQVLEALTRTMDDVTLDGNLNWTDQYDARYGIMEVGGDRAVLTCAITLQAHHPFYPTRIPPGFR